MNAPAGGGWREAPPAGWDELRREDPNAGPTHRPELQHAFAAGMPGFAPGYVAVERDGRLIGGAPAMVERRAGHHWIHAMPFGLSGAPLARAGEHAVVDHAVARALAERAASLGVVEGEWALFRPGGPPVDPGALAAVGVETRTETTAVIDLEGGAAATLRRASRRTRESVAAPAARALDCAEASAALEEAYALYAAQARNWPGHRLRSLELLRRMIEGPTPAARLFTARDSRGLLSAALTLVSEREWTLWWSGSHSDARRRHAFGALLWHIASRAADEGAQRMNLGASAGRGSVESFKKDFGATLHTVPIRWIGSRHAGPVGRAIARIQARVRAARARRTTA